jgi:serine phosphatase RsbU (regulator of sigma subunit)
MKYRTSTHTTRGERLANRKNRIAAAELYNRRTKLYLDLLNSDLLKQERFLQDEDEDNEVRFVGYKLNPDENKQKEEWRQYKEIDYAADMVKVVTHAVLTNAAPNLPE